MEYDISKELDDFQKELQDKRERENAKSEQRLLDQFAGMAMQGIISAHTEMRAVGGSFTEGNNGYYPADVLAEEAYTIAKAMMKARKEIEQ